MKGKSSADLQGGVCEPRTRRRSHFGQEARATLLILLSISAYDLHAGPARLAVQQDAVTIENDFLKAQISPAKGGAIDSLELQSSPDSIRSFRLIDSHVRSFGALGSLAETPFRIQKTSPDLEGAAVFVSLTGMCVPHVYSHGQFGRKLRLPEAYHVHVDASRIELTKTYSLRSDTAGLKLHYKATNRDKAPLDFTFSTALSAQFKAANLFVPTHHGVRSFQAPKAKFSDYFYNGPDAWVGGLFARGNGFTLQFENPKTSCIHANIDGAKVHFSAISTTVKIEPGKSHEWSLWLTAVQHLDGISFASDGVTGHWKVAPPEAREEAPETVEDLMKSRPAYKPDEEEIEAELQLSSATPRQLNVNITRRLNRTSEAVELVEKRLQLHTAATKAIPLGFSIERTGTWLLTADVLESDRLLARGQSPLDVGNPSGFFLPAPRQQKIGKLFKDFRYPKEQRFPPPHEIQFDWEPKPDYISPHVAYAKPYARGPVKALFICPFETARGVIELWQRMDLEADVAIVGLHGYSKHHKYYSVGEDHAPKDETDRVKDLLNKQHDVIVLGHYAWGWYPPDSGVHGEIIRQFREGTGVVISSPLNLFGLFKDLEEKAEISEDFFPGDFGKITVHLNEFEEERGRYAMMPISYQYLRPETWIGHKEADVERFLRTLIWAARKEPLIELSPTEDIPSALRTDKAGGHLCRFSAMNRGSKPFKGKLRLTIRQDLAAQYRRLYDQLKFISRPYDSWETVAEVSSKLTSEPGKTASSDISLPKMRDGIYSLDFSLVDTEGKIHSWYRSPLRVYSSIEVTEVWLSKGDQSYRADGQNRLSKGKVGACPLSKLSLHATDELTVKAIIEKPEGMDPAPIRLACDVTDRSGRVFSPASTNVEFKGQHAEVEVKLSLFNAVHLMNVLRVQLAHESKPFFETRLPLPIHRRPERTSEYKLRCYGYSTRWPDKTGIDVRSGIMSGQQCFEYAWIDQGMEQWGNYLHRATEITEDYVRIPCLLNPDYKRLSARAIQSSFRSSISFVPPRAFLADEWTYASPRATIEGAPVSASLNQCRCRFCLERFRRFLRVEYQTLENLNRTWGTQYKTWDEAQPPLFDSTGLKWINEKRMAQVLDHRCFIDQTVGEFVGMMDGAVKDLHPDCAVGISGNEPITPWNNLDIWQLATNGKHDIIYRYQGMWESFGVTGVSQWTGYSHKYRKYGEHHRAWSFFLQGRGVSYYGKDNTPIWRPDYGMLAGPEQLFEAIKKIKNGPAQLLWGHKARDPIAILYHTRSIYADMIERNIRSENLTGPQLRERGGFSLNAGSSYERLLHNARLQPYWISYEQLNRQSWDGMQEARLILLPYTTALNEKQIATIRKLVEAGATVVGDVNAALRDGHGKQQQQGSLDDLFGIRRERGWQYPVLRSSKNDPKTTVKFAIDGVKPFSMSFPAVSAPGIVPTTAKAHGSYEIDGKKQPALLVNKAGKGRAILLNFIPSSYYTVLSGGLAGEVPIEIKAKQDLAWRFETIMNWMLKQAGQEEPVDILVNGKPGHPNTFRRFARGRATYLGFCGPRGGSPEGYASYSETVTLNESAHIYEIVQGRYLGHGNKIEPKYGVLDIGRIYSYLPYRIEKIEAALDKQTWKAGERVTFNCSLKASSPLEERDAHVVRVEVWDSTNKERKFYRYFIQAPGGSGKGEVPLAVNDPKGTWKLKLTDVATGIATERSFRVE
ncbi:MAG: beta-galactosidase [Planctomycetota bacterium]|nr:beta-galactosidase [Planctomycetota bacterium]